MSVSLISYPPAAAMQIIESFEACKIENGSKRIFVKYVVVDGGTLYIGNWSDRHHKPTTLDQLESRQIVQTRNRGPTLSPEWTIANPSSDLYEKKPKLEEFVNPALEASIAHEIAMCEIVRHHSHPNLATYYGCVATNQGKASGLLFKKYERSLLETVNPMRLSKSDFVSSGRPKVTRCMRDWFLPLRAAVDHLHSIGYVHNDITPSNIMLDSQEQPIIIDFGSMCRVGEALASYKRTMEWHDQTVSHAKLSNDHNALTEIETWLFGSVHDFLFQ